MRILVNDQEVTVDEPVTVAALLTRLGYPDKGIAVAIDWTVIPRADWDAEVTDGARIEVVTAVQGG